MSPENKKYIYHFDDSSNNFENLHKKEIAALLGNKGASLAEMFKLGMPVPHGFTISTDACTDFYNHGRILGKTLAEDIKDAIKILEKKTGRYFGNNQDLKSINQHQDHDTLQKHNVNIPLLISVRSGAAISMPGMMDTILNLGLNDQVVEDFADYFNDKFFAYDSYRRLIQMYGTIVLKIDHIEFETAIDQYKRSQNISFDDCFTAKDLSIIIEKFKNIILKNTGSEFPQDPQQQLLSAIEAIFNSWNNTRAITYRTLQNIPNNLGTAANIQAMVFGNADSYSGTGVLFTRNPSNGTAEIFGDFLSKAQGEDIVSGICNTQPLTKAAGMAYNHYIAKPSLEELLPEVFHELVIISKKLEQHYQDMQDIEFTIEKSKLWILQTRNGKRTAQAAFKIANDLVHEKIINQDEAFSNIDPQLLEQVLHHSIDLNHQFTVTARGLPSSPGAASGTISLTPEHAEVMSKIRPVILLRNETSPDDIVGMSAAAGILTLRGGMTSHAAVIARGMGKPCVCSASGIRIDLENKKVLIGEYELSEDDIITINGSNGDVIIGEVAMVKPNVSQELGSIMDWSRQKKRLQIRANAETIKDASTAFELGAEGIGLCRTEHMFFSPQRMICVYKMILADSAHERAEAIAGLLEYQIEDFSKLFAIVKDSPITIRLLDPPLHEFLIGNEQKIEEFCQITTKNPALVKHKIRALHESNPMLGHRGCRLAITYPELYEMQVKAIFEAAMIYMQNAQGSDSHSPASLRIEIMIPFIIDAYEFDIMKKLVQATYDKFIQEWSINPQFIAMAKSLTYSIGTMIELPRAALEADKIGKLADFVSFGTNDLTQSTLGISRDDSKSFMDHYISYGIFNKDPFMTLDIPGVGCLIKMAVEKLRSVNPHIKIGVCGEHGGDPTSIAFFNAIGLDYVSCSPYRIPVAKLTAAQCALERTNK